MSIRLLLLALGRKIREWLELDYMEGCDTDAHAQTNYVTNDTTTIGSWYPTQDADHVKATTTKQPGTFNTFFATDPTKSLTGSWAGTSWLADNDLGGSTNQRFHIDLGSAKIVTKIYYENSHTSGSETDTGVKNFTFWGSNTAGSFAELTYGTDTGWTQLTTSQSTFDQHTGSDVADPKYITVTNTTAYRYYAFKFADNWGDPNYMGVRRIELQGVIPSLQSYSGSGAGNVTQGTYSLKGEATTGALNKNLSHTISPMIDLSGKRTIKFDIRASRTGSNIKIGFHDSGGTTTEVTPNITSANTFQEVTVDISAVSDANKDAISSVIITIINADAGNTFYIDNIRYS